MSIAITAEELKPSENTRKLAEKIAEDFGLDNMDSVHLALAGENSVGVFLSTDKDLYLYTKNCICRYGIVVKNLKKRFRRRVYRLLEGSYT